MSRQWPLVCERWCAMYSSRSDRVRIAVGRPPEATTTAAFGPEMMRTHLRDELELLERICALSKEELDEANRRGHAASFLT